jgi:hypothetical protein
MPKSIMSPPSLLLALSSNTIRFRFLTPAGDGVATAGVSDEKEMDRCIEGVDDDDVDAVAANEVDDDRLAAGGKVLAEAEPTPGLAPGAFFGGGADGCQNAAAGFDAPAPAAVAGAEGLAAGGGCPPNTNAFAVEPTSSSPSDPSPAPTAKRRARAALAFFSLFVDIARCNRRKESNRGEKKERCCILA